MTDEHRELVERAQLLRELTQHPGWQVLTEEILRRADAKNRRLLDGRAETVEEYRSLAGWIQGAKAFLEVPQKLEERIDAEAKRRREAVTA